ncbi:MAG: 4-hydroxy-3-methylbut-2-enyl diphosphate reductase, partial [Clostridia bacterium]|nr:4-hydroxy-3-methylbut-2-enyl diphosphate reductase [Clostridia bacterium]
MAVILADHAGFCFGVRRAVETAEKAAPALTLGPIIHNPQVVERLRGLGIESVEHPEEVPEGGRIVIRSHGVAREITEALRKRNCEIIDATCPFVGRIHKMAKEASEAGIPLIVVGEAEHPEVVGILGWTEGPRYAVFTEADVDSLPKMHQAVIVSQTTMVEERFRALCERMKEKIEVPDIRATICPATHDRQRECAEMAAKADAMIVIGGRDSSNSRKLYRLAAESCPRTFFIETAAELSERDFLPSDIFIGITAGASTPDCIIKEVVA